MLAFPLLVSSSVLLLPPVESLDFLCPKLLLILVGGAGLGELDIDEGTACSPGMGEPREGTEPYGLREGFRASFNAANGEPLPNEPRAEAIICSAWEGEADSEGLLNGMKETEGLLPTPEAPSAERRDDRDPCAERVFGGALLGIVSSGDSDPAIRAARSADRGLVPAGGPT